MGPFTIFSLNTKSNIQLAKVAKKPAGQVANSVDMMLHLIRVYTICSGIPVPILNAYQSG